MAAVVVSPTDPRSVRALAVLATADTWVKGHRKSDGTAFFVIQGSNGRVYWTNCRDCTCPDRQQRAVDCKHMLAVRMWKLQHEANAPKSSRKPACRVCTGPLPKSVLSGVCEPCQDAGAIFEGVTAVKAAFGSQRGAIVQTVA